MTQLVLPGVEEATDPRYEDFAYDDETGSIVRQISWHDGMETSSTINCPDGPNSLNSKTEIGSHYELSWLKANELPTFPNDGKKLRVADLFSGCGGLSLGLWEACRALGFIPEFSFASDINLAALEVYKANFDPAHSSAEPIESIFNGEIGAKTTQTEKSFLKLIGDTDFVIAGPPCQGHSDLNNHTRRNDPKNQLIFRVVRFAELFSPTHILIENVQGILHDRTGALHSAKDKLNDLGYHIDDAVLKSEDFGVAQARKRYFLLASKEAIDGLKFIPKPFKENPHTIMWAIEDLHNIKENNVFNSSSQHSEENVRRMDFLFDNDLFELPDSERPNCHKDGNHRYQAVYGRMYPDKPSPTITRGFGSMGQGRFVHPKARRTLTPHEAARVQFFPDFFKFGSLGRRQYQELIGNAVPSKFAYAIGIHQLRGAL